MTGCENKKPAAESMVTEDPAAEKKSYYFDGIVKHMHAHADQVDLINIARAASERITEQRQACHAAAGVIN